MGQDLLEHYVISALTLRVRLVLSQEGRVICQGKGHQGRHHGGVDDHRPEDE